MGPSAGSTISPLARRLSCWPSLYRLNLLQRFAALRAFKHNLPQPLATCPESSHTAPCTCFCSFCCTPALVAAGLHACYLLCLLFAANGALVGQNNVGIIAQATGTGNVTRSGLAPSAKPLPVSALLWPQSVGASTCQQSRMISSFLGCPRQSPPALQVAATMPPWTRATTHLCCRQAVVVGHESCNLCWLFCGAFALLAESCPCFGQLPAPTLRPEWLLHSMPAHKAGLTAAGTICCAAGSGAVIDQSNFGLITQTGASRRALSSGGVLVAVPAFTLPVHTARSGLQLESDTAVCWRLAAACSTRMCLQYLHMCAQYPHVCVQ